MAGQVKLLVNDVPVDVEGFVAVFFEHTIEGMLQSLRGTGDIGTLEIATVSYTHLRAHET